MVGPGADAREHDAREHDASVDRHPGNGGFAASAGGPGPDAQGRVGSLAVGLCGTVRAPCPTCRRDDVKVVLEMKGR